MNKENEKNPTEFTNIKKDFDEFVTLAETLSSMITSKGTAIGGLQLLKISLDKIIDATISPQIFRKTK